MKDEERSQVFDAHEELREAFALWKRDRSTAAFLGVEQAMIGLQRLDAQLLANMARELSKPRPLQWWQRD